MNMLLRRALCLVRALFVQAPCQANRRQSIGVLARFDVILRVAMLSNASVTCALAWCVPSSLTATLLADGGTQGEAVSTAMLMLVVLAWLDVLINDLAPEPFTFEVARARRHLLYSGLGAIYFLQAFASVGITFDSTDVLSLGYVVAGVVCAWYSLAVAVRGGYE